MPKQRTTFSNCWLQALSRGLASLILAAYAVAGAIAAPMQSITIDGDFSDWAAVPAYFDPDGGPRVLHHGIPDVHDTDHDAVGSFPSYVNHPDVDILEYKFTHDQESLYAYFKAEGAIGNTQTSDAGRAGRYYVIVTIDVDNDNTTGYFLHEGGYYPTSGVDRYDMNMEAEYYDGQLNTAHYLSHDAEGPENGPEIREDFANLTLEGYVPLDTDNVDVPGPPGPYTPGFVQPAPGNYDNYTQWVYHEDDTLTHVQDRGPVVQGIMTVARSEDLHEIEIRAPFKGFLRDALGNPNMALGKTIDVSFSLEASGELAPGRDWASDTADPIVGYLLESIPGDFNYDVQVTGLDLHDPTAGWHARWGVDLKGSHFLDWQRSYPGSGTRPPRTVAVPEPGPGAIVLLGFVIVTFRRRSGQRGDRRGPRRPLSH